MIQRYLPVALILGIGFNELFHAIFDIFDFAYKAKLVGWVVSMDKSADPDALRGIDSVLGGNIAYGVIWLAHAVGGLIAIAGGYQLLRVDVQDTSKLQRALSLSELGIGIGVTLYFVGFVTLASGFFLMHTAPTPPNFLANAQRLFLCYMAVIIYLDLRRR